MNKHLLKVFPVLVVCLLWYVYYIHVYQDAPRGRVKNVDDVFLPQSQVPARNVVLHPKETFRDERLDKASVNPPMLETKASRPVHIIKSPGQVPSAGDTSNQQHNDYVAERVVHKGTFVERLEAYNKAISQMREKALGFRLKTNRTGTWTDIAPEVKVLWANIDTYLSELSKYGHIKTVALTWDNSSYGDNDNKWSSMNDASNLVVQKYYEWSASEPLCHWINTPEFTKARWDSVYQRQCNTDMNRTLFPQSVEYLYFHGRPINRQHYWPNNGNSYPSYYYTSPPDQDLYLHVAQDVVITGLGDIISGPLKLVPYSCSQDIDPRPPTEYLSSEIYNEVFVITQYWGEQFFHKTVECLPRIAPYLQFLKENPTIKIHVAETGGVTAKVIKFLGLDTDRLVSKVSRAQIVYLPQATACGFAQIQEFQLFSKLLRERIHDRFTKLDRNSIVLIKRSYSRRFTQHILIADMLARLAKEHGLHFEEYRDNPVMSVEDTMQVFSRAVFIVAPHGAGLANMVYADPGTFVIEGVCNPPHVNMCFQWIAHVLGHHYHGVPSQGGCENVVNVDTAVLEEVMKFYLKYSL